MTLGVDLLDTGGCPSMQHELRSGGMNPHGVIVRHCYLLRGHDGNHCSALGFEWNDEQEVKPERLND